MILGRLRGIARQSRPAGSSPHREPTRRSRRGSRRPTRFPPRPPANRSPSTQSRSGLPQALASSPCISSSWVTCGTHLHRTALTNPGTDFDDVSTGRHSRRQRAGRRARTTARGQNSPDHAGSSRWTTLGAGPGASHGSDLGLWPPNAPGWRSETWKDVEARSRHSRADQHHRRGSGAPSIRGSQEGGARTRSAGAAPRRRPGGQAAPLRSPGRP